MTKMLQNKDEALKSLSGGVKKLAKAVKATMGPKGRNVVINKGFSSPLSTKDGVTVAEEITLTDKFEDLGSSLAKEAALKTSKVAGDGTTTAIVLTEAIFSFGVKAVMAGANPMLIKKGLDKAVQFSQKELDKLSHPIKGDEEVKQIATISANNDPFIGSLIQEAMKKVGTDGIVSVSEGKSIETTMDVVEGMQFDKGYLSPYFVTNPETMQTDFSNGRILVTDQKLSTVKDIVPFLEKIGEEGVSSLLIIAEDVEAEALATLVVNKLKAGLSLCAVKAPSFGEKRKDILQDICILSGATLVTKEVGLDLSEVGSEVLGSAKSIKISKDETTIVGGGGEPKQIEERIAQIKTTLKNRELSSYETEKLSERLARLAGGVAVISLGASTETEMKEKKARLEDALAATKAAIAEGVVAGGGVAFLRLAKKLNEFKLAGDEQIGVNILKKALFAPTTTIGNNCGVIGSVVAEKVYEGEGSFGFNGLTLEYEDLFKAGVIDPVLVSKQALENATSIASMLLTTAYMIVEKPTKNEPAGAGGMDGMGGMGGMGGMPGMGGMGGMPGMGGMGMPGMM